MEQSEVELIKARLIGPSADGNQFNASYIDPTLYRNRVAAH
jgi:hypothetical protein